MPAAHCFLTQDHNRRKLALPEILLKQAGHELHPAGGAEHPGLTIASESDMNRALLDQAGFHTRNWGGATGSVGAKSPSGSLPRGTDRSGTAPTRA